jgi:hypothetical protein
MNVHFVKPSVSIPLMEVSKSCANLTRVNATTPQDVERWLLTLAQMRETNTYEAPDFLRPFHLITFPLMLRALKSGGVTLPDNLANYAIRMGLYEAAGIAPPKTINKSSSAGRFHPIIQLTDRRAVAATTARLSELCVGQVTTQATRDSLESSISELLENCYDHAKSGNRGFHGLAAAQIWHYGHLAQIAIADTGVGIRARLMDNPALHALLKTTNACELATRYGVTADPTGHHTGYGMTLAKDLLRSNGGNLIVVSREEVAVCGADGVHSSKFRNVRWNGTLIIFEWNTNRKLDVSAVYKRWPKPEGFDDDEFM